MQFITLGLTLLSLVATHSVRADEAPSVPHPVEHAHQPASVQSAPVVASGPEPNAVEHHIEQPVLHYGHQQQPPVSFYSAAPAAAGVITVVGGGEHQVGSIANKPIGSQSSVQAQVRHYAAGPVQAEQYGQPESASIPANYKPFGSWGLYIGGNPADGYYTNYYKSLGNSVEKQVAPAQSTLSGGESAAAPAKPSAPAALGPMLRQASGAVYGPSGGPEVYPFEHSYYTPADLNSGAGRFVQGVQGYGTPSASYEPSSSLLSYADSSYAATKKLGQQKELQQAAPAQPAKGYQARIGYAYSAPVVMSSAPQAQQQQQPQVVAYPVPVGSQIVGSQPGVEGAYQPYGVHAFTRYAIKPTVVAAGGAASPSNSPAGFMVAESPYYSPAPSGQYPVYKQAGANQYQYQYQQPLGGSYYGYPMSQLHYASGAMSSAQSAGPVVSEQVAPGYHYSSMMQPIDGPVVVAASSEKSETSVEKPVASAAPQPASPVVAVANDKQQKP